MNAKHLIPALGLALITPVPADQNLETTFRTTGATVLAAFEPQRLVIQKSSAVIYNGRDEAIYGVVISPEGDILTKASELREIKQLSVAVDQKKYTEVKVLSTDPIWDVAHLKIPAEGLAPVKYAPNSAVAQGTWVVANGATSRTHRRILAGIISAKTREIPPADGAALGIMLKPEGKDLEIVEVPEKSGAKAAGLQKGDIITAIADQPVTSREDIAKILKDRKEGTKVKVTYRRNEQTATAEVQLMARSEMAEQKSRNDQMSGKVSERRSGFPRVLQTDLLAASSVIGGPLLDLDGRCLGMTIARANRAETFAIPVEDLKAIAERMLRDTREAEGKQID